MYFFCVFVLPFRPAHINDFFCLFPLLMPIQLVSLCNNCAYCSIIKIKILLKDSNKNNNNYNNNNNNDNDND